MNKFLSFFKKKAVYIPLILIVLLGGGFALYGATHKTEYQTAKAEKRDFAREVSVTGKVVAAEDVQLGFERSGKVSGIPVTVGTKVKAGATLAYLDSGTLSASLLESQGRLQAEQARLADLEKGTRDEEIENAENDVKQAKIALSDAVINSFTDSENAVRNDTDVLFDHPDTYNPDLKNYDDYNEKIRVEDMRVKVGKVLDEWKDENKKIESDGYEDSDIRDARDRLSTVREYFDELVKAVADLEDDSNVSDETLASYKSIVSGARSSVGASIASLNVKEQAYQSAKDELDLKKAGSTSGEIAIQEAAVKSAQASVQEARANLGDLVITAPFEGVVTKIDLNVGELVTSGTPVVSMISNANFEVESYIPEADIAKVKIGDTGTTTLDAYGDSVPFSVVVTAIDLSETEVDGVSTYKTTLQFTADDDRIRSGMTANIDLVSETRQGVLSIPQSAIISADGKRTVMIMDANGKTETKEIKTGSLDNAGNIEITDGVSEGDTVVTNPPKK